ncbi:uncharacterized protein Dana_GF24797, isoform B [Drosophila ananassae]|uniref:Uncharacterized protein, isoform B n=1 Tax=Drosophila ananassae TaxID=7217 RepID=A0A0P9AIJ7_DROAN|nr:uncharacterized protein LOC6507427 isoform X1 [Drosophila ananassae]KPU77671.1 uncharacterized protein Dana_GF24797, isoform B [Drosophila ananassae]
MFEPKHGIWAFFQEEFPNGQGAKRRKHVLRVFLALSVFLFLALVQWMIVLLALRDWSLSWFKENIVAVVLVYVFGVFLLLLFALSQHLRQLCFFNWLLVGIIVECCILSLSTLVANSGTIKFLFGLLLVSLICIIAAIVAAFLPWDMTENVLYLYVLSTVAYMTSLYSIVIYSVLEATWAFYIFAGLIAVVVLLVRTCRTRHFHIPAITTLTNHLQFLMYHVQCIMGGGAAKTELADDKYAALLLFHEFMALLVLTLYWRPIMQRLQSKQ